MHTLEQPPAVAATPLAALLADLGHAPDEPRLAVHPRDQMLAYLHEQHEGDGEQALCAYYRLGAGIARVLLQALRWRFGADLRAVEVLDFASGYGRVTRFLLRELSAARVTVSDVLPEAVAFQRQTFGVRGVVAPPTAERFAAPGQYDAVLVTSLFTHLPPDRFRDWLRTLAAAVAPGGVLLFSTHDVSILPVEERPAGDHRFEAQSEIAELPGEEYGSMWVREELVRDALAASGRPLSARRFPRLLSSYQDLWVVVAEEDATFAGLELRSEPAWAVEECDVTGGELEVGGWAGDRRGGTARVELRVGAGGASSTPHDARADVQQVLGADDAAFGWRCRMPLPAAATHGGTVVLLRAIDGAGESWPLWAGRLGGLLLLARTTRLRALEAELYHHQCWSEDRIERLEARLAAMQASRFWRLRNAWFACKRVLGLTDEP